MATTLESIRRYALSLPDTVEAPHHDHGSFRVNGRIFVTVPPDGGHLHVFVGETDRERALAMDPGFVEPLHWGGKVVGLRLTLARARPDVVRSLLRLAHAHKAASGRKKPRPGAAGPDRAG